jgi:hypothetical protein
MHDTRRERNGSVLRYWRELSSIGVIGGIIALVLTVRAQDMSRQELVDSVQGTRIDTVAARVQRHTDALDGIERKLVVDSMVNVAQAHNTRLILLMLGAREHDIAAYPSEADSAVRDSGG